MAPNRGTNTDTEDSQNGVRGIFDELTEEKDDRDDESGVEVEGGGAVSVVELGSLLDILPVHLLSELHCHV